MVGSSAFCNKHWYHQYISTTWVFRKLYITLKDLWLT